MKTTVIVNDGKSTIELTPENTFEEDVINAIDSDYSRTKISVNTNVDKPFGFGSNHKIKLVLDTEDKIPISKLDFKEGVVKEIVLEVRRWNRLWQDYSNDMESNKPLDLDDFVKSMEEKYFAK